MSVDGRCPLRDSFVICKSLVCIKFLKMIVIFPESPQTFTWGGSQNLLFIFRNFAFCMTKRLFPASGSKTWEGKSKCNLPPAGKRPSFIKRRKSLHQNQGGLKNGRRTLKIFWEDWYAREISRFVCNKVRLF